MIGELYGTEYFSTQEEDITKLGCMSQIHTKQLLEHIKGIMNVWLCLLFNQSPTTFRCAMKSVLEQFLSRYVIVLFL